MAHALTRGGSRAIATVSGRSERTVHLAERAGLELLPDLASVVREADVVLSIVPPEAAGTVVGGIAEAARNQRVEPLIADLNAIAPATARRAEATAAEATAISSTARSPGRRRGTRGRPVSICRGRVHASSPGFRSMVSRRSWSETWAQLLP
jgi:hypothetical protein